MVLKRATKSIPLSGGSNNETPDELLSPPGLLHIENARFTKKDYAEKTEPMTDRGDAGLTAWVGQRPFALEEVNGDLVSIGKDKTSRWNGTAFSTTDHKTDPMGIERILSTAEQAGGTNYSWCRMGAWSGSTFTNNGYIVTFEKRSTAGQQSSGTVDGYIHRYDLSGNLVDETKLVNSNNLRVMGSNSIVAATLFYQTSSTLYQNHIFYNSVSPAIGTPVSVASNVEMGRQEMKGTGAWNTLNTERLRLSFSYNCQDSGSYCVSHDDRNGWGVVAWKDGSTNTIKYKLLTSAGTTTGSALTFGSLAADTGATAVNAILDVAADATHVHMLHSITDTTDTAGDTDLFIRSVTLANGSLLSTTLISGTNGTIPHGSIAVDGTRQHVAYLHMANDVDSRISISPSVADTVVFIQTATRGGSGVVGYSAPGHRLASNLVIDNENNSCVVLEQYGNFTPNHNGTAGVDGPATTPAAIKPVTSVLVRQEGAAGSIVVLGVMDAGQSKVQDHGFSEQNNFLATLEYQNAVIIDGDLLYNSFTYCNRNITTVEDTFIFITDGASAPDDEAQANMSLNAGSSRGNLYRIHPGVPIKTVKYGEGFLMSTAVPMWFDGSGLSEASILDQPEIIGVSATKFIGTGAITWYGYNAVKTGYQTITAVCGYSDGAGKVHRSAPSFPLFVGGLEDKDGNSVLEAHAAATYPLTVAGTNREYFMEFYLAEEGATVGQLAATQYFQPGESSGQAKAKFLVNTYPGQIVANLAETAHQSPSVYTAGDVLPADAWPSFKHMAVTSRRMFALAEIAPSTIYYSKLFEENVSPEFSAALVISVGGATKLTAIGRIDDKIIAFEKDAVHLIYGSGPDNTGANGDFFVERMSTNFGCEDVESLLSTNDGLAYYSSISKEFHLITRDIQIVDIGKPVRDLTANASFDVKASLVYPSEHELRWYCSNAGTTNLVPTATIPTGGKEQPPRARVGRGVAVSNPVLVYNTQYAKWTVNDAPAVGYAATLYDGKPALMDSSFDLWTTGTDWTTSDNMVWETPWIKVNMLQDFGRIFKATFLGKYLSSWDDTSGSVEAGDLNIICSYDYEEDGDTDTHRFRANTHFGASQGERLQFSIRPDRPKCQAIKFRIEETATTAIEQSEPTYATGRGISLLSVDIHYGIKGGSSRISALRKL